jgi:uncharacterized delta-60 repeat protein
MARFLASLVLTLAFLPATAVAAPGDFDTSFGGDGSVSLDWGPFSSVTGVFVQPDGRIVASGGGGDPSAFVVARLTANGPLDTGFAMTTLSVVGGEWADDVARQPDGKIVAAGLTGPTSAEGIVMRLNPDGTADGSFGTGGIVGLDYGGPNDLLDDVLIQPDGKIVVVGRGGTTNDWVVTRLTPQGLPDPNFDGDGTAVLDLGGDDWASSVALGADGKLVIAGHRSRAGIWVARLNSDGSPDTSFSGDGRLPLQPASGDVSWDMVLQPDGRIVVAGNATGDSFLITRLKPDGSYDEDFADSQGLAAVSFGSSDTDTANAVALQASGKIVVAGSTRTGTSTVLAVARLQPGGSLDTTFSGDGKQTLNGATSSAWGVALQPDGRVVVSGDRGDGALVVRLQGDGQAGGGGPAPTPGDGPGGGGAGSKQVPRCAGKRATIVGTNRSNRLKGTRRNDVIVSLGGNDRISAGNGNDLICAGNGNDRVIAGLGNDRVYGQNGNDKIEGDSGRDSLSGGGGKDNLAGGSGRDNCTGNGGKDRASCERRRSL